MVFSAKWQVKAGLSWQSAVSRLIHDLERYGCVVHGDGAKREICVPGLDERVMAHLRGGSDAHEGLMSEDWKTFIQRELWSRAEICLNTETRSIDYQWSYWTSFQIAFHLLTAVIFLGTGSSVEWAWILFVPTVFAFADSHRLSRVFSLWHAKCSLGDSDKADR
jgi:hypothetical protein